MNSTEITFVNHASIIIKNRNTAVLSDPWYYGDAFHKGWNLLTEQSKDSINKILEKITHIWISHEHPDHFSIRFFLDFKEVLIDKGIEILFQKTKDKRVVSFLRKLKLDVKEIDFNETIDLKDDFSITCIKDGFYDSALFVKTSDKTILNLNDCEVTTDQRASEIYKITGECDILLTQFSYAAWKGGRKNLKWRKDAAKEKLESIKIQIDYFKPKYLIPFASFMYFSNKTNIYLNDCINRPEAVVEKLQNTKNVSVQVMKPFDIFRGKLDIELSNKAINFWSYKFNKMQDSYKHKHDIVELKKINESFKVYKSRIFLKNSRILIKLVRLLSPFRLFRDVVIELNDIDKTVCVNIMKEDLSITNKQPQLSMASESLQFIFNNPFGFDTLTVNGCFEEVEKNGFISSSKSLAIENLNNMGIFINILIFFNFNVINLFFKRIRKVKNKLRL